MNWRLGLDLGTNSIGWSVLSLNGRNEAEKLEDMGVRIFSDGREPKTGKPLAAARRTARGIRRNLLRRKIRRRTLFRLLQKDGLFPSLRGEAAELKQLDPYALRAKALDERLEPHELGRALFHLGVRRGFKSNRKDAQNEQDDKKKEKSEQNEKIQCFKHELKNGQMRTLGEYLFETKEFRFSSNANLKNFYPDRQMYEDEFAAIKAKQEPFYPALGWDAIHEAIFKQGKLEPQKRGKCQFMDEERTFKATPCSQQFRILQEVFNLTYTDVITNKATELSPAQQDALIAALDNKKEMSFSSIRTLLKINGTFNLETLNRDKLNGNATACEMRKDTHFGKLWDDKMKLAEQDALIETLITTDEDSEAERFLKKYPLTSEQRKAILRFPFPSGTASFCREATEALVATMRETRLQYDKAALVLGYEHSDQSVEQYDLLPYYGKALSGSTMGVKATPGTNPDELQYGKIANPTVHVALNQTRAVVNALIKKYGKPAQIVVETSRDLKASKEKREEITEQQKQRARQNDIDNQSITDGFRISFPNRSDRLKYRLWVELNASNAFERQCLYCGKQINAAELFSDNIEIDHILPFSKTLLDVESNKTVAHWKCNQIKGGRTPYEAFHANPAGYKWEAIRGRIAQLKNPAKRRRFSADALTEFEDKEAFIARQLKDTQYIARINLQYLKTLVDDTNIWATTGRMTGLLRERWDLDSILKRDTDGIKQKIDELSDNGKKIAEAEKAKLLREAKKNRRDHRHHALDAVVIGLVDHALVKKIMTENARGNLDKVKVPLFPLWAEIIEKMRNIVVSFKPDHGAQGKLSKETALGRIRQEALLPIEKLTKDDVPHIKDTRVRGAFEQRLAETKDFKAAVKEMQTDYPRIRVFRPCFVNRIPLANLKNKQNIAGIVDMGIQNKLREFVDAHPNEKFDKALVKFSEQTGIKRIRYKNHDQNPWEIKTRKNKSLPEEQRRYYGTEDYFAAIIWEIPPTKTGAKPEYKAQYVRRTEIDTDSNLKPEALANKPHPAATKICQLHKNDYIEFAENGVWKKARIAGLKGSDGRLDIRPIYATDDARSWIIATAEQMLEKSWKPVEGQNFVSVNVLFGKYAAHKIRVSPIGAVSRKAT
ncbi:type II CRISPR RNA-guided endonuclease Cas9 [Treponema endosymbiont of Eucomonympha sp.]|uniref:type II CRISPR RNA-guided endonuclease Cas9 n=1 Tax=Treponema endosymbiont of Eucomonympha sp. TaxID=1580831 RepID=UPI000AE9DCFA|nr:type II CRISPR RNA-guided endonuclease Cas9 [Treponema endosymbiont of Eucomonympha sp.]